MSSIIEKICAFIHTVKMPTPMKVLCSLKQFEKAKDTSNLAVVIQLRRKKGEPIRLMYGTMVDLAEKPTPNLVGKRRSMKSHGELVYEKMVAKVIRKLGHTKTTSREELNNLGKHFLGSKYVGTFAKSEPYTLSKAKPYAIVNTTDEPGEHWQAVVYVDGVEYFYDSFGEGDSEPDAEQHINETNCGQRSLGWLMTCHKAGLLTALEV